MNSVEFYGGEGSGKGSHPGAKTVAVPLEAKPHGVLYGLYALFALSMAVVALVPAALVMLRLGEPQSAPVLLFALVGLVSAAFLFPMGFTPLQDLLRPGPSLMIDDQGFQDLRCGVELQWSDVRQARYLGRGIAFRLREPVHVRASKFRIGHMPAPGADLYIPMQFLRPGAATLAAVFAHFIEAAGGTLVGAPIERPHVGISSEPHLSYGQRPIPDVG